MTQYVRPAQAYGAVADAVASLASVTEFDCRNMHRRIHDAMGMSKGTTQLATVQLKSGALYYLLPDAVYAQLVIDGVDFSDALYNSNVDPTGLAGTSKIPALWNPGLHTQVVDVIGTSIVDSSTGSGTFPELSDIANKLWSQSVVQLSRPYKTVTSSVQHVPDRAFTSRWVQSHSRLVRNFGRSGGRATNIAGYTYTSGSPWTPNLEQIAKQVIASGQQHVFLLDIGTNDIAYADDNGNPGLDAVPTGTPGATYDGSPNFIEDSLEPLIAGLQAIDPSALIVYSTPVARGSSGTFNPKFDELASYVVANRVALGIDAVVDTRTIPQVDCRTPSVTNDTDYYQADKVHLRAATNLLIGAAHMAALDGLL